MAISNGYCTLADLKTRLSISDSTDDTMLEDMIEATSRWIDTFCRTRFYVTSESRYYTALSDGRVIIDDCTTVSALVSDSGGDRTYETEWESTDFDMTPFNAETVGEPYTAIQATPDGSYSFPTGIAKGVKVTGSFGAYSSAPEPVKEACLLLGEYLYKRKDAPTGVLGIREFGFEIRERGFPQDVLQLLEPYRSWQAGTVY